MAQPFRPRVKYVARERWEHCRRAAEQYGEQIEADRSEDQPVPANVTETFDHLSPRIGPAFDLGSRHRSDREEPGETDREQNRAGGIRCEGCPGVEIAA